MRMERPLILPPNHYQPTDALRGRQYARRVIVFVGLTARLRRATSRAQAASGGDALAMLRNPVIVCLTLAAIVVVATIAEAVVIVTSRRRRIAW